MRTTGNPNEKENDISSDSERLTSLYFSFKLTFGEDKVVDEVVQTYCSQDAWHILAEQFQKHEFWNGP